ncbi:MAG: hypothetical protein EOO63_10710 [Hymenobacter sp.]|nr:MAG: hypothetical protein EOO63_10710 [Hymenobacter sp.]
MRSTVQCLTNEAGERTAGVVAYAEWEKLQRQQRQLKQKLETIQGFRGVQEARRTGRALPSLREFLSDAG